MSTERFEFAAGIDPATLVAEFHPDRVGKPGSGAIRQVEIDGAEWPEVSKDVRRILDFQELPGLWVRDQLYDVLFLPRWAAILQMALARTDQFREVGVSQAVYRFACDFEPLHDTISAAERMGATSIEITMLVEEEM